MSHLLQIHYIITLNSDYTRQKVNWLDLEEESEEEKLPESQQKPSASKPKQNTEVVKKPPSQQTHPSSSNPSTKKEKHTSKNVFACDDLEIEDATEKEVAESEKLPKKENALSDLLSNHYHITPIFSFKTLFFSFSFMLLNVYRGEPQT